jgi:hypothetical protein
MQGAPRAGRRTQRFVKNKFDAEVPFRVSDSTSSLVGTKTMNGSRAGGLVHMIRHHFGFPTIVLQVAMLFWGAHARADAPVHIDLPAQPLAQSLKAIGAATNTDVGFDANQVAGLMAPAIKADLTVDGALMRVLAGDGIATETPRWAHDRDCRSAVDPGDFRAAVGLGPGGRASPGR